MLTIPENRYLGTLCVHGHDWEGTGGSLRKTFNRHCVVCLGIANAKWKNENPEKAKAYVKAFQAKHPEYSNKWKKNNYDRHIKAQRKRRIKGVEEIRDSYVRERLGMGDNVPQELIEAKRLHLQIFRLIRDGGKKDGRNKEDGGVNKPHG